MTAPALRKTAIARACAAAMPGAAMAVYLTPLAQQPDLLLPIQPGCSIASTLPAEIASEVVVCRCQGVWILRADWQRPVCPGDMVEWHVRPQGGGNSDPLRTLLQIAVIALAATYAPYLTGTEWGVFAGANTALVQSGLIIGANLAINAALGPGAQAAAGAAPTASPSYTASLSGNAARLDGAIPVLYGYNRTYPDFAGQPYADFDNASSDQYYHALLSLGHGEYLVPRIEIYDTALSVFGDVTCNILPPGIGPSLVNPAVVTAPEVTGQELTTARYVGAFAASAARQLAAELSFDLVLAGLGVINGDGSVSAKTVSVRFECRPIDDFGAATGPWVVLGSEDITAATADAVRRSYTYATPTTGRYLARAVRTSAKDDNLQVLNTVSWVGLRATLAASAPLDPTVTHIEIRMRASEQLNGLSQRRIAVTSLRKLHTWAPETGWSASVVETRNPAWALADKWRSTVYGDGLPDSRIDLASLHALAQVWDERQDRCDIVFDTFTDSGSADQVIAGAGRAAAIWRNGVRTVVRDQAADLPITAYPARTMRPGSWSQSYGLPTSESADGVILEYWSNRAWDWISIECPAPGRTYTDSSHAGYDPELPPMARPVRERLLGVTGATHAEREGRYRAAKLVYRRNVATWSTELQGVLPAYGSAVVIAPALPTWAQSGDVVAWDADTLTLELSEPATFGAGTHAISLMRDDGSLAPAIVATAGADAHHIVLATEPDFGLITDSASRERPKYVFGLQTTHRRIARMLAIEPSGVDEQGAPVIAMTAVIEDDRIHTVDADLLPAPEEEQDPISLDPVTADPGDGGGTILEPTLTAHSVIDSGTISGYAEFSLLNDGRARAGYGVGPSYAYYGGQWLPTAPATLDDTELFEVRATEEVGAADSGPIGTWLSLDTTRTWAIGSGTAGVTKDVDLLIEIRDVATSTVQTSAVITLSATCIGEAGGD